MSGTFDALKEELWSRDGVVEHVFQEYFPKICSKDLKMPIESANARATAINHIAHTARTKSMAGKESRWMSHDDIGNALRGRRYAKLFLLHVCLALTRSNLPTVEMDSATTLRGLHDILGHSAPLLVLYNYLRY